MRVVSADWVVPVEGAPIENGAVAIADDGTIAAVGAAAELGQGEHHDGCVIVPGFVNAHSHLEYAVYAGFGDGLPFVPWIGMHVQRKEALDLDDMVAIATVGAARVPPLGDHDDRRLQLLRRGGARRGRDRPARDRLPRGLRPRRVGARPVPRDRTRAIAPLLSDRVRLGVSPHAPVHLHARGLRAPARRSGCRRRRTSPRAPPSATGSSTARATGARWPSCSCRRRARPGSACSPPQGCSDPSLVAAHCVHADAEEIALLARARRRRRALPALERLPRLRRRTARRSSARPGVAVSIATDSPASTPSLDLFEEIRSGDRRRARPRPAPRRALGGAGRSSSRRSAAPACSASTTGSGRSSRASRPTSP